MGRYVKIFDGEWIDVTDTEGTNRACCDCGLVHHEDYKIVEGKIFRRVSVDKCRTLYIRGKMVKSKEGFFRYEFI